MSPSNGNISTLYLVFKEKLINIKASMQQSNAYFFASNLMVYWKKPQIYLKGLGSNDIYLNIFLLQSFVLSFTYI